MKFKKLLFVFFLSLIISFDFGATGAFACGSDLSKPIAFRIENKKKPQDILWLTFGKDDDQNKPLKIEAFITGKIEQLKLSITDESKKKEIIELNMEREVPFDLYIRNIRGIAMHSGNQPGGFFEAEKIKHLVYYDEVTIVFGDVPRVGSVTYTWTLSWSRSSGCAPTTRVKQ